MRSSWGSRFERFVHNNVEATQRLLEALHAGHAARLRLLVVDLRRVRAAADARGRAAAAALALRRDQAAGEQLCRVYHVNHGLDTVALRFFTVYGPRSGRTWRSGASARPPRRGSIELFGDGRQRRDFTYVADVVSAIRAAGSGRRRPRLQHRRRLAGQPQRGARAAGRDRRPPARRHPRRARVGRRPQHGRRHEPRTRSSASLPRRPSQRAAGGVEWVLAAQRRPRLAAVSAGRCRARASVASPWAARPAPARPPRASPSAA